MSMEVKINEDGTNKIIAIYNPYELSIRYTDGLYTEKAGDRYLTARDYLPENYVFDDNLTVKENRERIEKYNQRVKADIQALKKRNIELKQVMREDVINYLIFSCDLSRAQANVVEAYLDREWHSNIYDYFANIDDVAEFANKILYAEDSDKD